ncbi:hypothetical protein MEG1DRAFT_00232 [Photorhabdus temperata subsp. temperata Meg1]|uniref:Uncharacterized protein n=1 Tax=Photorhabdus temperata subsp. temperata Meg1 TaxID=1393735 RepID=A0A081S1P3_PHOTE|nr:hypothetical protein MEG1DRAFT_00232 [Photorhabdus temperata subsp. temperata Meg1]
MMARYDISDDAWILIEPCLPPVRSARAGRPSPCDEWDVLGVMFRRTAARFAGTLWFLENDL